MFQIVAYDSETKDMLPIVAVDSGMFEPEKAYKVEFWLKYSGGNTVAIADPIICPITTNTNEKEKPKRSKKRRVKKRK